MLKEMCVHGHVHICVCAQECLCGCTHFDMMKDLWDWVVIMLLLHNHDIQRLLAKKKKKQERKKNTSYTTVLTHILTLYWVSMYLLVSSGLRLIIFVSFLFSFFFLGSLRQGKSQI